METAGITPQLNSTSDLGHPSFRFTQTKASCSNQRQQCAYSGAESMSLANLDSLASKSYRFGVVTQQPMYVRHS
jgi:hypothetical protein